MMASKLVRRRSGFTLVELMVAAAVSVIIMAILATVFQSGIDTMREMRSLGNLQDQLRAATEMIRRDLAADHFVARDTVNASKQLVSGARLSDQRMPDSLWTPPAGGFFRIKCDGSWSTDEGSDPNQLVSTSSKNNANFQLHFTSILLGDRPQNMYSTNSPSLTSPAAEIAYFLDPVQYGSTGGAGLFKLMRRQRLVARTVTEANNLTSGDTSIVAKPATGTPYTLADLCDATKRMSIPSDILSGTRAGDDVLLSNVISFEVMANWEGGTESPRTFAAPGNNKQYPFDYFTNDPKGITHTGIGLNINTFDTGLLKSDGTWSGTSPGDKTNQSQRIRMKMIQIKLRVYDPQIQTTRQVTIVQDM